MRVYKDQEILEGILNNNHRVLNYIYSEILPRIERMVIHSGGDSSNAGDIFQEAMIIIYRKVRNEGLELRCKFSTYLYGICRNLWLQEFKYGDRVLSKADPINEETMVAEPEPEYKKALYELFDRHYQDLSPDCRKILDLHFRKFSVEEIQKLMNYRTLHYVMDKKYRCKKSLVNRILNDPDYKKLNDESK